MDDKVDLSDLQRISTELERAEMPNEALMVDSAAEEIRYSRRRIAALENLVLASDANHRSTVAMRNAQVNCILAREDGVGETVYSRECCLREYDDACSAHAKTAAARSAAIMAAEMSEDAS